MLARGDQRKIIVLFGKRNKAQLRRMRDRRDGHAPIGATLRHRGCDRIMRARLVPVTLGAFIAEHAVDQDARA